MKFLVYLILINFFLFLPMYIFGVTRRMNPFQFILEKDSIKSKLKNFYVSRKIAPFCFSIEYSMCVLILLTTLPTNIWVVYFLDILAVLILCFTIYLAVFAHIFHKTPILKIDWEFIQETRVFYKKYNFVIYPTILAFVVVAFLFFHKMHLVLQGSGQIWWLNGLFLIYILVLGFYNVKNYKVESYLHRTVFSMLIYIRKSSELDSYFDRLVRMKKEDVEAYNVYTDVELKVKPNIHFISMESYGSVLFKEKERYNNFLEVFGQWSERFNSSDIKVSTVSSEPPLFAYGTWYSYSTLLFGMKITDGIIHRFLFSIMANFRYYDSILGFLKKAGYTNYLLHGMLGAYNDRLDFSLIKKNFNYDQLINPPILKYVGKVLKFMRIHKTIPDQYTLNAGLDIAKKGRGPYTYFYCTLNSHWDFHSPVKIQKDFRDLNQAGFNFETNSDLGFNLQKRYQSAMIYTVDAVFEMIYKRIEPKDIYIVYGDHQPTTITDEKYGKDTQIHIFSKDETFNKAWEAFGFSTGLMPAQDQASFKFEAFYSALMQCLNKCYGQDPSLQLPFYKEGLPFFEENSVGQRTVLDDFEVDL